MSVSVYHCKPPSNTRVSQCKLLIVSLAYIPSEAYKVFIVYNAHDVHIVPDAYKYNVYTLYDSTLYTVYTMYYNVFIVYIVFNVCTVNRGASMSMIVPRCLLLRITKNTAY